MDASDTTPGEGERPVGGSGEEILRCPYCSNRWLREEDDLCAVISCSECGREFWVCAARLCQIGDGEEWIETVEVSVPGHVVEQVEAMEEVTDTADAREMLRHAVSLEIVFEWEGSG